MVNGLFVKSENIYNSDSLAVCRFTSGYTMEVIAATSFGMELEAHKTDEDPLVKYAMKFFKVTVMNPFVMASCKYTVNR